MIYRQNKPVHWSPSSRTALAEAELEYDENHKVTAAFIKFPLTKLPAVLAENAAVQAENVSALIWTTTPWTLPANKAIAVRSDMGYVLLELQSQENTSDLQGQMLVAKDRVEPLLTNLPEGTTAKTIIDSISGSALEGTDYANVLSGETCKIIHADFVTSTSGTGLVHLAPGHGMDDYNVCMKLGIGPAFAPVDDAGKYTADALPSSPELLQGLEAEYGGAKAVIKLLRDPASALSGQAVKSGSSLVLLTHTFRHKNPIDWRTKKSVIVRATEQWFADAGTIRGPALEALDNVTFKPNAGKGRLQSFLQGRSQWCISRQRSWGVPIPALFRKDNGEAVMTKDSINHIIGMIKERGTDAWWSDPEDDPRWIAPSLEAGAYVRGKDTMDVWFDSGTSWTSLDTRPGREPADVYVEGTDQHRGWFQSSLLTHIASNNMRPVAPFKTLITHGFTLDKEGRKMSKSLGNVISPEEILNGALLPPLKSKRDDSQGRTHARRQVNAKSDIMGPDVLRLWVASSDYTKDVVIGQPVLQAVHQSLQKYRVTFKWLLGVMEDYPAHGPAEELLQDLYFADQVALHQLSKTAKTVYEAYSDYDFFKGVTALNRFINADLSAFYFEVIKDRLYADEPEIRMHTQTVLFYIIDELLHMLAPITPLLVEEVWHHMAPQLKEGKPHPLWLIWDEPFAPEFDTFTTEEMDTQYGVLQRVSTAVKAAQEEARRAGKLGSGLASSVRVHVKHGTEAWPLMMDLEESDELSELFVVSDAVVVEMDEEVRKQQLEMETEEEAEIRELMENPEWKFEAEFDCGVDLDGKRVTGKVEVCPPVGEKCVRCWQYIADEPDTLCGRCVDIVGEPEEQGEEEEEVDEEEEEEDEEDYFDLENEADDKKAPETHGRKRGTAAQKGAAADAGKKGGLFGWWR